LNPFSDFVCEAKYAFAILPFVVIAVAEARAATRGGGVYPLFRALKSARAALTGEIAAALDESSSTLRPANMKSSEKG